jgi:hypothetical protein
MENRLFRLVMFSALAALVLSLTFSSCAGSGGTGTPPKEGPGEPPQPPPPWLIEQPRILRFKASPPKIRPGNHSTLEWQTANATSVSISNIGPVSPSGWKDVEPQQTTSYVLTAKNSAGQVQARDQVEVEVMVPLMKAPEQKSPPPNAVLKDPKRKTKLTWNRVDGAQSYTVEIDCFGCCAANKWCADVGKSFEVFPSIGSTEHSFEFKGKERRVRWRVWAVDKDGHAGPKSGWRELSYD